jgi:transcriptional regulator with XRE-family HTH domain
MSKKNKDTNSEFILPSARAERLRRLRNMANLTREILCNIPELNASTYKGWEIGRFGGLSVTGAKHVIKRVAEEGVICSLDWLLEGKGNGPFVVSTAFSKEKHLNNNINSILQEIIVFQSNFSEGIFLKIQDDSNLPLYNIGDHVAGIKKYKDDIQTLINQICIVQTTDNELLVRQLLKGETKDTYTLVCTNLENNIKKPVLYNIRILSAAPIIRHYRDINLT